MTGNNVSHANNRRKRRWFPNLQTVRVMVDGAPRRVQVCTQCLKSGQGRRRPQPRRLTERRSAGKKRGPEGPLSRFRSTAQRRRSLGEQLDPRHLGAVAGAMPQLEDPGVAARPGGEARADLLNSLVSTSRFGIFCSTCRIACRSPRRASVMSFSAYGRSSFAFATVVLIPSCSNSDVAMLRSSARRWLAVRESCRPLARCRIGYSSSPWLTGTTGGVPGLVIRSSPPSVLELHLEVELLVAQQLGDFLQRLLADVLDS